MPCQGGFGKISPKHMLAAHRLRDWLWLASVLPWAAISFVRMVRRKLAGPLVLDVGERERRPWLWGSVWATPRLQIRQAGVFRRKLFRWEDIDTYYLHPKGLLGLKLRNGDWVSAGGQVAKAKREELSRLLAARLKPISR